MFREHAKDNPYNAALPVQTVGFTIGAEATNVINVALALKDADGLAIAVRGNLRAYLASSATTLAPVTSPPAVAIGTNGALLPNGLLSAITALTDSTGGATGNNTLAAIPAAACTIADTDIDDTPSHVNVETAIKATVDNVVSPIKDALADLAAKINEILASTAAGFNLVSSAAGLVDINITKSGAATYYLVVLLPDGTVQVSGAITFAA